MIDLVTRTIVFPITEKDLHHSPFVLRYCLDVKETINLLTLHFFYFPSSFACNSF